MKGSVKHPVILAMVACLLWSSAFVSIKIGLQYTTPLQFAGIRFMLSGLLLLPFCGSLLGYMQTVYQNYQTVLLIAVFQTGLLYTLFYLGINLLPAAVAAIIIGAQPLIIAILAHFWDKTERLNSKKVVSITLGLSGVLLISFSRGEVSINSGAEMIGIALLIGSNLSAGIGNMLVAKTKTNMPYLTLNSIQLFIGGLAMFLLSLPVEGFSWQLLPYQYYISLAWLSFLSAAALSIWFHLLRNGEGVSELNIWKFLIPVSGACLSWIILADESPEIYSVSGMILIVLALVILYRWGRKKK